MRCTLPFAVAALLAAPVAAQPHGLAHSANLGEQTVGDTLERDVLDVPTSGSYSQIRICAWKKPSGCSMPRCFMAMAPSIRSAPPAKVRSFQEAAARTGCTSAASAPSVPFT